ncbi:replication initiator protein A [Verminephrobacter eiseniae]|uniref:replication initiator protein A n=1 Tax=Verminephrobacter eiseniae TaxID=364317 RepID=UPI0018DC9211
MPQWLYSEVVEVKSPAVLTVHPEYFLIEPGIGRFLYRLARRAAGKARAASVPASPVQRPAHRARRVIAPVPDRRRDGDRAATWSGDFVANGS